MKHIARIGIIAAFTAIAAWAWLGCSNMLQQDPNRDPGIRVIKTSYISYPGVPLVMDASESFDLENQTLSYSWVVTSAPAGATYSLSGSTSQRATFTSTDDATGAAGAITPNYSASYAISVTVTDKYGKTSSKPIAITVRLGVPVVSVAPTSYTVYPGLPVSFDASLSSDPDGSPLTYSWAVVSGPAGASSYTLSNATTSTATFVTSFYASGAAAYATAPYIGTFVIHVTATDKYGVSSMKPVVVIVADLAPTAAIAWNGTFPPPGTAVNLNGSSSNDPDPDRRNALIFAWSVIDEPRGTNWAWNADPAGTTGYIPAVRTTATATFAPGIVGTGLNLDGNGVYTLRLTVTDEYGLPGTSAVVIPTSGNTAPTAAATVTVTNDSAGGLATTTAATDVDATPGSAIAGVFYNGAGPTFNLYGSPSDQIRSSLVGAHDRNLEQDTLDYRWVISEFSGAVTLKISNVTQDYTAGATLSTSPDFSFQCVDFRNFDVGAAHNFRVTLNVSDGALSSPLPLDFSVTDSSVAPVSKPTAAVTGTVASGTGTVPLFTAITASPATTSLAFTTTSATVTDYWGVETTLTTNMSPVVTLDGGPSALPANNPEEHQVFYRWVVSGFTGSRTFIVGATSKTLASGATMSFDQTPSFRLVETGAATAVDFVVTLVVTDGSDTSTMALLPQQSLAMSFHVE